MLIDSSEFYMSFETWQTFARGMKAKENLKVVCD